VMVDAVCAYPKKLGKVAAGNPGALPPPHWSHDSRRRLVRLVPPIEGLWPTYIHAECICNEIIGVTNRVIGEVPLPTKYGLSLLDAEMRQIARFVGQLNPETYQQFVARFVGRRRSRYENALASMQHNALTKRDFSRIKAFVKSEKRRPDKNSDPRIVQFCDARAIIADGVYIRPFEERLYQYKQGGMRIFAKGMDVFKRGYIIPKKMSFFANPLVVMLDAARFDQHLDISVIKLEHKYYSRAYRDPQFDWQLRNEEVSKVTTRGGLKYTVVGKRLSGCVYTACGNNFTQASMANAAAKAVGFRHYDLLLDGDDCLLFIEADESDKLELFKRYFLEFGQELKLEGRATIPEGVQFCQCKPIRVAGQWRMVRWWNKVLSQDTCGYRRWQEPNLVRSMLTAVGMCNLALNYGVPILQEHAIACLRNGDGKIPKGFFEDEDVAFRLGRGYKDRWIETKPIEIDESTRLSFELAFGVGVDEQLSIEAQLRSWTVEDVVSVYHGTELDHRWKLDVHPSDPLCHLCYI